MDDFSKKARDGGEEYLYTIEKTFKEDKEWRIASISVRDPSSYRPSFKLVFDRNESQTGLNYGLVFGQW
jgi:hypothetical protein